MKTNFLPKVDSWVYTIELYLGDGNELEVLECDGTDHQYITEGDFVYFTVLYDGDVITDIAWPRVKSWKRRPADAVEES